METMKLLIFFIILVKLIIQFKLNLFLLKQKKKKKKNLIFFKKNLPYFGF